MAPSHIFQIFLWVTIQNQISIAQWVVVDEIIQFGLLRHGYIQRILDPGAVEDEYGNTPAQRAELDWLLYNKPLEYAQMVLKGEMEHYLSLECDHGRLEDRLIKTRGKTANRAARVSARD